MNTDACLLGAGRKALCGAWLGTGTPLERAHCHHRSECMYAMASDIAIDASQTIASLCHNQLIYYVYESRLQQQRHWMVWRLLLQVRSGRHCNSCNRHMCNRRHNCCQHVQKPSHCSVFASSWPISRRWWLWQY